MMNSQKTSWSRRHFLRGIGTAIALPTMESLASVTEPRAAGAAIARTASGAPLRMAHLYVPNGVMMEKWRPEGLGFEMKLGGSLESLEAHRSHLQVFSGFEVASGWGGRDGGGDHARANATMLTGVRVRKTAGADIQAGISVDQAAARVVAAETRFASLELTCDSVRASGNCDSGYSCAYQANLSWRGPTTPATPEGNPRQVFERLFGSGTSEERERSFHARREKQRSILDFVLQEAADLNRQLGRNDRNKMDEYLTSVREIEQRLERMERLGPPPDPEVEAPDAAIPGSLEAYLRLMMDMQILAFRSDSTRISTLLLASDGNNRNFKEIGVTDGHHSLSHHQGRPEKLEAVQKIDAFYARQFAYYLEQMKSIHDAEGGSLLDNSMIVYGSGISDGDRHNHDDLPIIVAGRAGGQFESGRHVVLPPNTPLCNLHLRLLNEMGVTESRFGDSTEVLKSI